MSAINWQHAVARARLLRHRIAVPGWLLAGFAVLQWVVDVWGGAMLAWRLASGVPVLGWFLSPPGLVLLAVAWFAGVVVRPWSWHGSNAWQVERVRSLLVEAADAMQAEADKPPANGLEPVADRAIVFMHALELLDEACVASIMTDRNAFMEREQRMYKEADEPMDHQEVMAGYFRRTAARLTSSDVDPGFRVPESFTEWCSRRLPNVRPVQWRS